MKGNVSAEAHGWLTRQLSVDTWADFAALFSRGNGWDYCSCMYFQRGGELPTRQFPTRADRQVQNAKDKCELVERGLAHGILVYDEDSPIGWCQFGRPDELPLAELVPPEAATTSTRADWRITCFVTDKRYRHHGVASTALSAALDAIRASGGGVVEATPVAGWSRGPGALETRDVDGLGPVVSARGTFGHVTTQGTVAMFQRAGFEPVEVISRDATETVSGRPPESHVVMRRRVTRSRRT